MPGQPTVSDGCGSTGSVGSIGSGSLTGQSSLAWPHTVLGGHRQRHLVCQFRCLGHHPKGDDGSRVGGWREMPGWEGNLTMVSAEQEPKQMRSLPSWRGESLSAAE